MYLSYSPICSFCFHNYAHENFRLVSVNFYNGYSEIFFLFTFIICKLSCSKSPEIKLKHTIASKYLTKIIFLKKTNLNENSTKS